jgi:acyl-CoA thioester hydrolase
MSADVLAPLLEPIVHRVRVRYCETDRMGVAHHGSYVAWFEEARTEWMRARGASYRAMEDAGDLLLVVHLDVRYRSSVTYDDELAIEVGLIETRNASVTIGYVARSVADARLVATGRTTLACVGRDGKLRRLPDALRAPGSAG